MRGIEKSVIFAATLWEVGGVVKSPKFGYRRVCEFPFEVWENDTKRLVITRIGLASSSLAFAWAAQRFTFDEAINIGSVGAADSSLGRGDIGKYFDITKVSCIEPYCETHFELSVLGGIETATLATTSRPVSTLEERAYAAKFGRVADMEGWALAQAAQAYSKKLYMRKILSDFSPECDIHASILAVCAALEKLENFWV